MSFHEKRKAGSRGRVAEARQLPLPRVGVVGIGKPRLTVAVTFLLAPEMLSPLGHRGIVMETTFHGLEFLTSPGRVFTPRATTEALVEAALARIDEQPVRVADVGTGAGVIGVSIAVAAPQVEVYATDINADAVALARENAARHGVGDRVHVLKGDLLEPVPGAVEIVVANLPYLPAGEHRPEYDDEPPEAVYAPGDGLGPLQRLVRICEAGKLAMPGFVLVQYHGDVLEEDCQQLPELRERLSRHAAPA
jgi:HemK-like putative methylase